MVCGRWGEKGGGEDGRRRGWKERMKGEKGRRRREGKEERGREGRGYSIVA